MERVSVFKRCADRNIYCRQLGSVMVLMQAGVYVSSSRKQCIGMHVALWGTYTQNLRAPIAARGHIHTKGMSYHRYRSLYDDVNKLFTAPKYPETDASDKGDCQILECAG